MKVAFLSQPFNIISPHDQRGSIEIWTHEVTRRLARHCDVIVYSKKADTQKAFERYQGVQYRRISATTDEKFVYMLSAVDRRLLRFCNFKHPFFASSLYYLMYALKVAKDLESQKCDIVHIQNFSQFVPIIRTFNPKIKIVLHMRCEWLTQLDRAMIQSRLREVDLVIGCSHYITEKIRRRFPQFAKRCQTVLNGVDVNHFASANDQNVAKKKGVKQLLFVGRVSPEKGVHVLLEAFQKVVERYPLVHLEIVGSKGQLPREWLIALSNDDKVSNLSSFYHGFSKTASRGLSYFTHLQRQLFSFNISNHVTFTGQVPYAQVINYYHEANILVNPSFSESFGRSLIEAMACQVPVVATRVGGMTEIVEEGKTGILVEPGDAPALAEAIIRLLSDEGLRKSMGEAARKRAIDLYSWEKTVEDLLCHYKNICDSNE